MDDLLREAIADAKAVRETALANAKIALEEAFTPRLQSMLSKKIATEMEDAEEMEDKLSEEEDAEEMEDKDEEENVEENDVSSEIGKADNKVADKASDSSSIGEGEDKDEEDDIDLDEVLKALSEEEDAEEEENKVEELKKEIQETRSVVKYMRAKLNEVNLLNAKLLFSNKLFRAFGLNNNQKLKVVENFDRTKNLREVKLVYATLAESFKSPKKLSESVSKGSSSKPTRSTKPAKAQVLSEGAEMKARFKKLANIL